MAAANKTFPHWISLCLVSTPSSELSKTRPRIQAAAPPIAANPVNPRGPLNAANAPSNTQPYGSVSFFKRSEKAKDCRDCDHSASSFTAQVDQEWVERYEIHEYDRSGFCQDDVGIIGVPE